MDSERDVLVDRTSPVPAGIGVVWLVVLLSLGSGLVWFAGFGLVAVALRAPVAVVLGVVGGVVLLVWLWTFGRVDALLFAREVVRSEKSEAVPVAEPVRELVSVEIAEPERGRVTFLDVPCSLESLRTFGRGLASGRPFSESEWSGAGRPFSRAEFRALRASLMERGFVVWRDESAPTLGVRLTASGDALARYLADMPRTSEYVRDGSGRALLTAAE